MPLSSWDDSSLSRDHRDQALLAYVRLSVTVTKLLVFITAAAEGPGAYSSWGWVGCPGASAAEASSSFGTT